MKTAVNAFLFMEYDYHDGYSEPPSWAPTIWPRRIGDTVERMFVREVTVEVDVPDDFEPRAKQIAALKAQKRELQAKFHLAVTELNSRIANLQAITYEAAE